MSWDEILKTGNVLHWRMSCGSSFQSRGPDTEKRRSPRVVSARGTDNISPEWCQMRGHKAFPSISSFAWIRPSARNRFNV